MNRQGDIEDERKLNIPLRVYDRRPAEAPVDYFVDARDLDNEYVKVTVFEDGGADIEPGRWYHFVNARGNIHSPDVPIGIEVQPYTEVRGLDGRPDDAGPAVGHTPPDPRDDGDEPTDADTGREERAGDVRSADEVLPFGDRRHLDGNTGSSNGFAPSPLTTALISGLVTAAAVTGSLFAGALGPLTAGALILVATLLATASSYFGLQKRYLKLKGEYQEQLLDVVFASLENAYEAAVPDAPTVRANVMLAADGMLDDGEIRIRFVSGEYGDDELEQSYSGKQGCWAHAYAEGELEWYDAETRHYAEGEMTAGQKRITEHIQSALSVPIRHENGDVVGVLTVDSTAPVDRTRFDDPEVQRIVARYARTLPDVVR